MFGAFSIVIYFVLTANFAKVHSLGAQRRSQCRINSVFGGRKRCPYISLFLSNKDVVKLCAPCFYWLTPHGTISLRCPACTSRRRQGNVEARELSGAKDAKEHTSSVENTAQDQHHQRDLFPLTSLYTIPFTETSSHFGRTSS